MTASAVWSGTGISSSSAASMRRLGKWLNELPKPCGLLAANDRTAVCVLSAAARTKVAVPDELSVLGVDDNEAFCETASPPLSSIRNDFRQNGVLAGELLFALSRRRKPQLLQAFYGADTLVRRLSTRPARQPYRIFVGEPSSADVQGTIRHDALGLAKSARNLKLSDLKKPDSARAGIRPGRTANCSAARPAPRSPARPNCTRRPADPATCSSASPIRPEVR